MHRFILYGSRARGDCREDSDWDLLLLIDKTDISQTDYDLYVWPLLQFGWNIGEYFSVKMYSTCDWEKRKGLPFYKNVTQEGIAL